MDAREFSRLQAVEKACQHLASPGVRLTKTALRAALATPAPPETDPVTSVVEETV